MTIDEGARAVSRTVADVDVTIIGGGIVGVSTAMSLAQRGDLAVSVLEAEDRLAPHQTGHNSGVIHSGLYYKPGSLKARLCVEGRTALYRFCAEKGIAHERCGKVVVATNQAQLPVLNQLEERGKANGLVGIRRLSAAELRVYEPHAFGIAALLVPETGIVDYTAVTEGYADAVRAFGGRIHTGARVHRVVREPNRLRLETAVGDVSCRFLINCAGLRSDDVARMCGVEPRLRIIPFRGEYYKVAPRRRDIVRNLIYPVPDPQYPFLGVHFTRMIGGSVEAGPNAVLAFKREGYSRFSFSPRDALAIATYRGFWSMAAKHWRMGLGEMYRSMSKSAFVGALKALIPGIDASDLTAGGAGVRAQAVEPDGRLVDDFRVIEADRMVHVLNAPSPAATASMSIGRYICDLALRHFARP
jgi:L-2-hydroxyglutarate oxidase